MRYMIISYIRRPSGQMDEVVQVSNRIKNRDLQSASVILDFQKQVVIKASLEGNNIPHDWQHIVSYYTTHYSNVISRLQTENEHDQPQVSES